MPSRLRLPGFAPKSRQIARRVSALSLSQGILDVAAIWNWSCVVLAGLMSESNESVREPTD